MPVTDKGFHRYLPVVPSEKKPLTPRMVQILELLAEGMTYAEMARELGVSPNTIKNHMSDTDRGDGMLRRMGARNSPHAVAIAFREGVLK